MRTSFRPASRYRLYSTASQDVNHQLDWKSIAARIRDCDGILVMAGAGMGVDSGLPDFRGAHGFWNHYPVYKNLGLRFEDLANPSWFANDPDLAWGFYGHRLDLYRSTIPHDGFRIIREFAKGKKQGCFVVTSNIDGQFQKAGYTEDQVYECHGSIHYFQSVSAPTGSLISAEGFDVPVDMKTCRANPGKLPRDNRGDLLRPNVLMFNDWGWDSTRAELQRDKFQEWFDEFNTQYGLTLKLVVIEIGAGDAVSTIRRMSEEAIHKKRQSTLVRINPLLPTVDHLHYSPKEPNPHFGIPCGALESLKNIEREYKKLLGE